MGDGDEISHEEYTPKMILTRLNEFRKEGKFCDVKIVVGDSEFLAHKVILAAFSPYLEEMFSKGLTGNRYFILELNCVEASLVDILLEYAYTTEIKFSESIVSGLLHLAKFFKACPLMESCCQYMEDTVNAQNCVAYYKLAVSYSRESLKKKTVDCIGKNMAAVCREKEFLELPTENVRDIFACNFLNDHCCEINDAVLRWYHFKRVERCDDMSAILRVLSKLGISGIDGHRLEFPADDYVIYQA